MADEWKVGDEVAEFVTLGHGYTGRTANVSKVYRNGILLIEGRGRFRSSGNTLTKEKSSLDIITWVRLTDDVRPHVSAAMAEIRATAAAGEATHALGMMVRTKTCAAHIDAINAFLAAIAPDQEGL